MSVKEFLKNLDEIPIDVPISYFDESKRQLLEEEEESKGTFQPSEIGVYEDYKNTLNVND